MSKAVARRVRTAWTRLLHPWRSGDAQRRVRMLQPRSILFVCHGNINRSAYAEARFRQSAGAGVSASSAGFIGPGRPSPALAVEVAAERGVSLEGHRARLVGPELVRSHDLVVVMDARQAAAVRRRFGVPAERVLLLGDLDPLPPERRLIQDPVERPREDYERIFDRIDRCVAELIRSLR